MNWRPNSRERSTAWLDRETSRPVATEMNSAGTALDSPSPIVKRAYTPSALSTAIPCSTTPMASPPTMFTTMMIMLAIDSPRTNRLAPSMLAKKSA